MSAGPADLLEAARAVQANAHVPYSHFRVGAAFRAASGRIFVLTNLGAVAAIDAYSGATAWLTIYPRDENDNAARQRMAMAGFGLEEVRFSFDHEGSMTLVV